MRSYETARSLFGFLEFIFWSIVAIGVIGAAMGAEGASRGFGGGALVGALPGLALALLGLLGVAMIQNARAGVDAAEYSQQMLKVARDQLEISKQALRGTAPDQPSFSAVEPNHRHSTTPSTGKTEPPVRRQSVQASLPDEDGVRTYNGNRIEKRGNHYYVDERPFITLGKAKKYINEKS